MKISFNVKHIKRISSLGWDIFIKFGQDFMKKVLVCLLIFSMLLQIGCSSITQIPLPIEATKSESDIRSLNYFGERLSSTILLTDSIEVEAYWLKLRDDKIYFLTEGLNDTTSVSLNKIQTVRFYDAYGGCMKGGLLSLGLIALTAVAFGSNTNQNSSNEFTALTVLLVFAISTGIGIVSGLLFFGGREFNFVQSK